MPLYLYTSDLPTNKSKLIGKSYISNPTFASHCKILYNSFTILSQFTYFNTIPICLRFFHDSLSQFILSTCVLHTIPIFTIHLWLFTILSRFVSLYNVPVYLPKICLFYPILHKFLCNPSLIPQSYIHTV